MTTLYEITETMMALQSEPDLPEDAIRDTLEGMAGEFNDKAVAVLKMCSNVESDIDQLDAEIKRLQERKKQKENFISRFREYLRTSMSATGITKIQHPLFNVTLGKPAQIVEIDDPEALPEIYAETVVTIKPDKAAIKKALQAGDDVPGARLADGKERLLIR